MARPVLAPKVKGTFALDSLLNGAGLDFMILCSSINSTIGGFGLVDYCAANAFQDAFAHHRSSRLGAYTVAIDWGIWQWDDWQESLVVGVPEMHDQLKELRETCGMTLEECVEVLARVLSRYLPQLVVSTQDFAGVLEQSKAITASSFMEQMNTVRRSEYLYSRPELGNTYVGATNEIEQTIIDLMRDLFGIEGIGINDNFFDLGGNSVVAITLISRLRKQFDTDLSINVIFEAPTVAGMARIIAESQLKEEDLEQLDRLLDEIEGMSPDEIQAQLMGESQSGGEGESYG
jgi:acyl carrier protein